MNYQENNTGTFCELLQFWDPTFVGMNLLELRTDQSIPFKHRNVILSDDVSSIDGKSIKLIQPQIQVDMHASGRCQKISIRTGQEHLWNDDRYNPAGFVLAKLLMDVPEHVPQSWLKIAEGPGEGLVRKIIFAENEFISHDGIYLPVVWFRKGRPLCQFENINQVALAPNHFWIVVEK